MSPPASPHGDRSLLLVHAHPDDESIGTGATMARYAAEGARVTLITCTLGEEGEIVAPDLAHLAPDRDDRLGQHRVGELAAACAALGVADYRFLGGPGRYRDSGMMDTPSTRRPDCFWQADLDEAAGWLVEVVREVRPQVVVTYDERGLYGHPDHIQTYRVTRRAVELAAHPGYRPDHGGGPWRSSKLYATAVPVSVLREAVAEVRAADADHPFAAVQSVDELPFGTPDEKVTSVIDGTAHLEAKQAAMWAHRSQIRMEDGFFALSNDIGQRVLGREYYTLLAGERGPGGDPNGWETDLFAGLADGP